MPAYNAEKTIKYAIKSVQRQSFRDWKLIVIDDGSVDSTLSVCQHEAEKDSRIIVLHQENAGQFEARKNGLFSCTEIKDTDYVTFLDSDDAFYGTESLSIILKDENSDVVCAGFMPVFNNKSCKKIPLKKGRTFENIKYSGKGVLDAVISFYGGSFIGDELWGKFFKAIVIKDAFERIIVHPKKYAEDLIVNLFAFANINSISLKSNLILCYALGGVTSKFMPTFFDDFCIVDDVRLKLINQYNYERRFLRITDIQMYNVAISWLEMCYHSGKYDDQMLIEEISRVLKTPQLDRICRSSFVNEYEAKQNRGYLKLFVSKDVEKTLQKVKISEPANSIKSRIKRVLNK